MKRACVFVYVRVCVFVCVFVCVSIAGDSIQTWVFVQHNCLLYPGCA